MKRESVLELLGQPEQADTDSREIDYFRLTQGTGRTSPFYLELKYSNDRVSAFCTQHFNLPNVEARGKEAWVRIHAAQLEAEQLSGRSSSQSSP
jgi:hypothetical protein